MKTEAIEAISIYSIRWAIEKTFRTLKQKLGFNDNLSRSIERHKVHIFGCLAAYAIAELIKEAEDLKSLAL